MSMPANLLSNVALRELRDALADSSTLELAEELPRMSVEERAVRFRLLDKDRALAVFEALDPVHQQELLEGLRDESVRELVETMEVDDRARLLDEVPAKVATRLLAGLSPAERVVTAQSLGYDAESAGRIMTPEFASLRASMSAETAINRLRRLRSRPRHLEVLPVTDESRRLLGVVDLSDVVTASPDTAIAELVAPEHHWVRTDTDREAAARLMQEASLVALPVVDGEDRLVGLVTFDDAMDVLEAEDTEDISRAGGAEPLERPYLSASVWLLARKRAVWLLALAVAASLTVNVLDQFEGTLAEVTTLALFIPLLIGAGGNAGAQAATTVVRALAVGEVRFTDLPRILWREARVGVLLGVMLGAIAFPAVSLLFDLDLGAVVALTLVTVCAAASFVGACLPVLARKLGIDPAVVSAPMLTTLIDATGLVIYFLIARLVLGV